MTSTLRAGAARGGAPAWAALARELVDTIAARVSAKILRIYSIQITKARQNRRKYFIETVEQP
ncbi:MAG TPA: hypothetical protein VMV26_16725 [Alphaproteobacteria bacterium]|jgi:hypothetical protein|nr:hypothetical protein [Alphaproteobacteria bacterium]